MTSTTDVSRRTGEARGRPHTVLAILFSLVLFLPVSNPLLSQSQFYYVETDIADRRDGLVPYFRDVVRTADGGSLLLYSSEKMSPEFAGRNGGPALPTLGIMKIDSRGDVRWSRLVDDLRELVPRFILPVSAADYLVGATYVGGRDATDPRRTTLFRFGPLGTLLDGWVLPVEISGNLVDGWVADGEISMVIDAPEGAIVARMSEGNPQAVRAFRITDPADERFVPLGGGRDSTGRDIVVGSLLRQRTDGTGSMRGAAVVLGRGGEIAGGGGLEGEGISAFADVMTTPDGEIYLLGTTAAGEDRIDTATLGFPENSQAFPLLLRLTESYALDSALRFGHNRFHLQGGELGLRSDGAITLLGLEKSTPGSRSWQFSPGGGIILLNRNLDTLATIPIGRARKPVEDQPGWEGSTATGGEQIIQPVGYPRIVGMATGSDDRTTLVGSDINGMPVILDYRPYSRFDCMETAPMLVTFNPVAERLLPYQFTSSLITLSDLEAVTPGTYEDTIIVTTLCPLSPVDRLEPDPLDFDILLSPNFIRRGSFLNAEVHIANEQITAYQIEVLDIETGEREVLVTESVAPPYNEVISLPTSTFAPGPYMLVLKAEERERVVRFEVEP